jgi:flagellar basal-body rod protein FlgG
MLLRGLATASNGMQALIDQNDLTANNIANVNTVGFKKGSLIFKNIYDATIIDKTGQGSNAEVRSLGELSMGSQVQKLTYDFTQGAMSRTGGTFDLAVEGDGFFKTQSTDGDISYTRNGSFTLNNESNLVTKDGDYVLDGNGEKIKIDTKSTKMRSNNDIIINERGEIQINTGGSPITLQTLGIYDFRNKEDLVSIGGSKFKPADATTNPEIKAEKFNIQQGALEMSNANVVTEMISTINTSRNYEALAKNIKDVGDSLNKAIQIGRIRG